MFKTKITMPLLSMVLLAVMSLAASANDVFDRSFDNGQDNSFGYESEGFNDANDGFGNTPYNPNNRGNLTGSLIQSSCEQAEGVQLGQSEYCNCYANAINSSGLSQLQIQELAISSTRGQQPADQSIIRVNENAQNLCRLYQ